MITLLSVDLDGFDVNFVLLLSPLCLFHLVCNIDVAWSHVTELERDGLPSSSDSVFTQSFLCQALFRVNFPTLLLLIGPSQPFGPPNSPMSVVA